MALADAVAPPPLVGAPPVGAPPPVEVAPAWPPASKPRGTNQTWQGNHHRLMH